MSPEVIGGLPYDVSADIFSLGLVSPLSLVIITTIKSTTILGIMGDNDWSMSLRRVKSD